MPRLFESVIRARWVLSVSASPSTARSSSSTPALLQSSSVSEASSCTARRAALATQCLRSVALLFAWTSRMMVRPSCEYERPTTTALTTHVRTSAASSRLAAFAVM